MESQFISEYVNDRVVNWKLGLYSGTKQQKFYIFYTEIITATDL